MQNGVVLQLVNEAAVPVPAGWPLPPGAEPCAIEGTYAPPPRGFNPLTASSADLEAYGFPPKPSATFNSPEMQNWIFAMSHAITPAVNHPDLSEPSLCGGPQYATEYDSHWAGHVVYNSSYGGASFTGASADWTMPSVPSTGLNNLAAFWVGTDDNAGHGLVQTGVSASSTNPASYSFWNEDYPQNPVIQGPAVSPGQGVFAETQINPDGTATYFEENTTTGVYQPFTHAAPYPGYVRADFIVERQSGRNLANFGSVSLHAAEFSSPTQLWSLTTTNQIIQMTSNCAYNGTPLATAGGVNNSTAGFSVTWNAGAPYNDGCQDTIS